MKQRYSLAIAALVLSVVVAASAACGDSEDEAGEKDANCQIICDKHKECHPAKNVDVPACKTECVKRVNEQKVDAETCEECVERAGATCADIESCWANCPAVTQ